MVSNLAMKLRQGTRKSHTMVENTGFIKCFLKGVVDQKSYRKLVANFYYIYSEMEDQIYANREHPLVSRIYFPVLNRCHSLVQDLNFYYGEGWQQIVVASPAAEAYIKRIRAVSQSAPELLIAHAYTRYIGDLSGGQILKRIAQRAMSLAEGEGTAFYDFKGIEDAKQFKAIYRQRLNELPIDAAAADRIVDEAKRAFNMNMVLFEELEGSVIQSIGNVLFNSLVRRRVRSSADLASLEQRLSN